MYISRRWVSLGLVAVIGVFALSAGLLVRAYDIDTPVVNGCVNNLTSLVRIPASGNCSIGETAVDWPASVPVPFPFVCPGCNMDGITSLKGKDLRGAYLKFTSMIGSDLEDTNLTDAYLRESDLSEASLLNTNLTNAYLQETYLLNATDGDSAIITGATFINVTCPDGTNSENNGDTCAGHW